MSEQTSHSGIRLDADDPIVVDAEATLDEVYGALSNERRRRVLSELTHDSVPIDVNTLARRVAVQESSHPPGTVPDGAIRKVQISLFHHHLPKLADVGLITYDADERVIDGIAEPIEAIRV